MFLQFHYVYTIPILKGHFSFVCGDLRQLHKTTRHSAKMTQTSHRVSFYCKKVIQLLLLLLVLTYYSLIRKKMYLCHFKSPKMKSLAEPGNLKI